MTLVTPTVTYSCETWTLSVPVTNNVFTLGRQILGRIYGAVRTEEGWRKRNNDELEKLINGQNIVKYTRAHRTK
jgi:hypothetical protein